MRSYSGKPSCRACWHGLHNSKLPVGSHPKQRCACVGQKVGGGKERRGAGGGAKQVEKEWPASLRPKYIQLSMCRIRACRGTTHCFCRCAHRSCAHVTTIKHRPRLRIADSNEYDHGAKFEQKGVLKLRPSLRSVRCLPSMVQAGHENGLDMCKYNEACDEGRRFVRSSHSKTKAVNASWPDTRVSTKQLPACEGVRPLSKHQLDEEFRAACVQSRRTAH